MNAHEQARGQGKKRMTEKEGGNESGTKRGARATARERENRREGGASRERSGSILIHSVCYDSSLYAMIRSLFLFILFAMKDPSVATCQKAVSENQKNYLLTMARTCSIAFSGLAWTWVDTHRLMSKKHLPRSTAFIFFIFLKIKAVDRGKCKRNQHPHMKHIRT